MNAPLYTSETRKFASTTRSIGKCGICKKSHRVVATYEVTETQTWGLTGGKTRRVSKLTGGRDAAVCCGVTVSTRRIEGRKTDTACDERCTEATGHRCECSCGGKNHGGGFDL